MNQKVTAFMVPMGISGYRKGDLLKSDRGELSIAKSGNKQSGIFQAQHLHILSDRRVNVGDTYKSCVSDAIRKRTHVDHIVFPTDQKVEASTDETLGVFGISDLFLKMYADTNGNVGNIEMEMRPYTVEEMYKMPIGTVNSRPVIDEKVCVILLASSDKLEQKASPIIKTPLQMIVNSLRETASSYPAKSMEALMLTTIADKTEIGFKDAERKFAKECFDAGEDRGVNTVNGIPNKPNFDKFYKKYKS